MRAALLQEDVAGRLGGLELQGHLYPAGCAIGEARIKLYSRRLTHDFEHPLELSEWLDVSAILSMGTMKREARPAIEAASRLDHEVGIVGAGFGGIIAGMELLRAGHRSFIIFEQATEVGGVWRDNVYPGCACDVLSHLYCMARYPNPDWTAAYATQPEILNYLRQATKEAGLEPHLRLGSVVVEAQFLQDHGCWRLILGSGAACHVRMLILATGLQNRPLTPALPSLELFHGSTFHSARWDTSVDLREKRVAVIGTGASSVQIVPSLAGKAAQLVVFQRTPAWVFPRKDRTFSKLQRRILHAFPATQAVARVTINWLMELVGQGFLGTSLVNRLVQFIALRHLRSQVSDEEIRSKLTPDHLIGCKRLVMSDDFYPAFSRPDVALVTAPISAVEPTGIRTSDGTLHEVDHIVFATGFAVADFAGRLRVVGRDGRVLSEVWISAPEAYLGITVSGFPNLAMLLGPNSALGHSSQLQIIESQVAYVIQYIDALRAHDDGVVFNVLPAVQNDYNRAIQARLANTVWATGCNSWYLDRLGRNTTIFPGLARHYRKLTARFDVASYACERVQAIRAS